MSQEKRMEKMEDQLIDMRLAVSSLIETSIQHQRNFETIQRNFETIMGEMRDIRSEIKDIQLDVRGLQIENSRILDILQNRPPQRES